jgi:cytochrome c-type biogenesis protein CcmH/NrfG
MFQLGKVDSAIVLFKEAVRIDPKFSDAQANLASALKAKKAGGAASAKIDNE